jgi:hypothetical protein
MNRTGVAEIHNWTSVDVKDAPEGELVEVTTWERGQAEVRVEPSDRGSYSVVGGWIKEDGSPFPEGVEIRYWRPLSGYSF